MCILFYLPGKLLRDGQYLSLPSSNPCNYDSSRGLNNEAHTGVFWGEASFPESSLGSATQCSNDRHFSNVSFREDLLRDFPADLW